MPKTKGMKPRTPKKRPPARKPRPVPKRPSVKPAVPRRPKPAGVKPRPVARKPVAVRLKERQIRREKRRAYRVAGGTAAAASAAAATAQMQQQRLESLSQKLGQLQEAATLADVYDDLEDIDSALAVLPTDLEQIRARGYVFRNFLERKIEVLAEQWAEMRERVMEEVSRRSQDLAQDVDEAERALQAAQSGAATAVSRAENAVQMLESKVSAAQDAVEAMFDTLEQNVDQTQAQLEQIEWMLDQAEQASFDFYPDENLVAVCRAQLLEREDEGPEGLLFLTDGRLIFERKEEVVTERKKVLFVTVKTEKETVQEFLFEVPIGYVEETKAREVKKGIIGRRREMLELFFAPEADISEARLRLLDADSEEWARLIGRVRSGDIDKERIQLEEAEAEEAEAEEKAAQEVPTKCPTCGALLTTPIVKGMREITCEYCGTVIRL